MTHPTGVQAIAGEMTVIHTASTAGDHHTAVIHKKYYTFLTADKTD